MLTRLSQGSDLVPETALYSDPQLYRGFVLDKAPRMWDLKFPHGNTLLYEKVSIKSTLMVIDVFIFLFEIYTYNEN